MKFQEDVFLSNIEAYIKAINNFLITQGYSEQIFSKCIKKLSFKLPQGLLKKDILSSGKYPVISQSKEYIIGYADKEELLVQSDFPLIVFGDHTKTVKYITEPFIIGADGVKIIKPIDDFIEKFFYYNLLGLTTYTKNYGRHYKLLKKEKIILVSDKKLQQNIIDFLDDLQNDSLDDKVYFNRECEKTILTLQNIKNNINDLQNEIQTQQTLLKKLRQSILQEAIEGKLTTSWRAQNSDIESASILLEKIKAEKEQLIKDKKIKKQKPLSPINKDEIPFNIPDSWEWCRLDEISLIGTGATPLTSNNEYYKDGNINWVTSSVTSNDYVFEAEKNITQKAILETNCNINPIGTLVIAMYGQGKTRGQITELMIEASTNQACATINPYLEEKTLTQYIKKYFNMIYLEIRKLAVGSSQPNLNMLKIRKTIMPLPPLKEQKQIVQKIETLFKICDNLETQINNSKTNSQTLIKAVLKEAFEMENKNV